MAVNLFGFSVPVPVYEVDGEEIVSLYSAFKSADVVFKERAHVSSKYEAVWGFSVEGGAVALEMSPPVGDEKRYNRIMESERTMFEISEKSHKDRLSEFGFKNFQEFETCVVLMGEVCSASGLDTELELLQSMLNNPSAAIRNQAVIALRILRKQ